jgi:hypothetical protein
LRDIPFIVRYVDVMFVWVVGGDANGADWVRGEEWFVPEWIKG